MPESINELCESIREHGVIQPIVVRKMGDKFEIIAGERRFRASKICGLKEIDAIVKEYTNKQVAEIAIIENLQNTKEETEYIDASNYSEEEKQRLREQLFGKLQDMMDEHERAEKLKGHKV